MQLHQEESSAPDSTSSSSAPPAQVSFTPVQEPTFEGVKPIGADNVNQTPTRLAPSNTFSVTEPVEWSTGLCGWYTDLPNCCITFFCPCITFGEFSEIIDRGSSSCPINGLIYAMLLAVFGCACMYSFFYRVRMRQQFNIKGSRCGDCCIHLWCEIFALCQEHRELKLRGFNLHAGWHANVENHNIGVMNAPPIQTGMKR